MRVEALELISPCHWGELNPSDLPFRPQKDTTRRFVRSKVCEKLCLCQLESGGDTELKYTSLW